MHPKDLKKLIFNYLTLVQATSNTISLAWAPNGTDIKIRNYVLGYGKGLPDVYTRILDEKLRFYEIKDLEPNAEYVLALRARNQMGDGEPAYGYTITHDEEPTESGGTVLEVPVRLRAVTMSSSSIVVYWTDNSVARGPHTGGNRFYRVRYNPYDSKRYKYHNTTDTNCMIDDLRANTQYEFAVQAVKGRRESAWSMSEVNTTFPLSPVSPPRDLSIHPDLNRPHSVLLKWLPPRNNYGQITGYVVFYTTDLLKKDREWDVEAVVGDTTSAIIHNLQPHTTYYFKVQTRNGNKAGTFSATISYTTGNLIKLIGAQNADITTGIIEQPNFSKTLLDLLNEHLVYVIGAAMAVILLVSAGVAMAVCGRKPQGTPEGKHGYSKNNTGIKPPDLWIHHDQMELKNIEKNPQNPDGASSSGALTLPRSGHEYDSDISHPHVTNSLDKRSYAPGYMSKY